MIVDGIIRYAIETKRYHEDYVKLHTNASYIISDKYEFKVEDGLFSGFDPEKKEYDKTSWGYAPDQDTKAYGVDPTLANERCVFQLLKQHVDRYTPEMVERICGTPKASFLKVAEIVTSTGNAEKCGTITYALGWTQHSTGVQIIRAAAMLQLLLGNVGRPGGGVNAFRGHSNIQGATDMAGTFEIIPGYLKTPTGPWQTLAQYNEATTPTTLNKAAWPSMNYWQNTPKFMVSLLKATWGDKATPENEFGYSWLPKIDGNYSWLYIFDDMYRGKSTRAGGDEPAPEGFLSFGMNPVGTGPNSKKMVAALSKLKWLVVVENVETETAQFWRAPAEYETLPANQIQTEVYLLPAASFAEKDGTFTNSARWLQWKWKAAEPPGPPWIAWRRSGSGSGDEAAPRLLGCGVCGAERHLDRIACAACGQTDPAKLAVFQTERHPAVRIEACDACQRYIKAIDLTLDGRAIPEVDDLCSLSLDLWAAEQGYERLEPSLAGV